jgi:hypothetical protein
MIHPFYRNISLFCACLLSATGSFAQQVSAYKVIHAVGVVRGKNVVLLRQFRQNNRVTYLTADADSLTTMLADAAVVKVLDSGWQAVNRYFPEKAYCRAVRQARANALPLQDAGISHGFPAEKGITLTIDLCPSHKPLDREVFTALVNELGKKQPGIPVALSITGSFMRTHPADMVWLQQQVKAGNLTILWINHTYNHVYDPHLPLQQNFLLEKGTSLATEVLETEVALLQQGLLPSVFFRFPGLVSNRQLVDSITTGYGLIPVGSDAWLAKGQPAATGSIVLIHGNGNEPLGIQDFLELLRREQPAVYQHQWLLYDLRETIREENK